LGSGVLCLVILSDERELLLDVLDDFKLGGGGEGVATLEEELLGVLGDDTAGDLHLLDGVRDGETFEDGNGMSDTITGVNDETSGSSVGVEGHDGLDGDVCVLDLEGLEHGADHSLSVLLGVPRSLSDEDTLDLAGLNSELVVEGVMPDLLHVVPVGDNTIGDGVLEVKDTSLLLGLVTDVLSLLGHALHGTLVLGATDNRWESGAGSFLTSNTSFHHTGSIIDDHNRLVVFSHISLLV